MHHAIDDNVENGNSFYIKYVVNFHAFLFSFLSEQCLIK